MSPFSKIAAVMALAVPFQALAQPVELTTHVLVEVRKPAADGTVRVELARPARVTPGDHVVYQINVRNSGGQVASNIVITNPVPVQLSYAGPAANSAAPELSVDGVHFGTLAQLSVRGADGRPRTATAADVRVVRWKLNPVAAGGSGQVAFRAILK
jgi:uncharacterized repeat protein (TIGR01451 family)